MAKKRAFVTGARRGIGKGIAVGLAQAGYDVAITARTVQEGEEREHSSTVKKSVTTPLPGSLTSTADLMREAGAGVMVLTADSSEAGAYRGKTIEGQEFCYQNNLLPSWTPKTPPTGPFLYPAE